MSVRFEKAMETDINQLTHVMKRAFDDELKRFRGKPEGFGPPGYDDGSFLNKWGFSPEFGDVRHFYKILFENQHVGAFIMFVIPDGKNFLGTIFIDPKYQDKGIGTQAMKFIFSNFSGNEWQLETPEWSKKNHHFYEKLGFIKIGEKWEEELDKESGGATAFIYNKKIE